MAQIVRKLTQTPHIHTHIPIHAQYAWSFREKNAKHLNILKSSDNLMK